MSLKTEEGSFIYEFLENICPDFRIYFSTFKRESFNEWISIVHLIELNNNDILYFKGSEACDFYIIIEGSVIRKYRYFLARE